MKLTTEQIKQIIKEELSDILKESQPPGDDMDMADDGDVPIAPSSKDIEKMEEFLLDKKSLFGYSPDYNQGVMFLESFNFNNPGIAIELLGNLIGKVDIMIKTTKQDMEEMRKTSLPDPYEQEKREKKIYAKDLEYRHLYMKRDELIKLAVEKFKAPEKFGKPNMADDGDGAVDTSPSDDLEKSENKWVKTI